MIRLRFIAEGFCDVVDRLARLGAGIAAILLALIPALIISDLLLRVMSLGSLESVWEYSTYFMAASVFLGSAHTLRTGGHIRVGLLSFRGHPLARKALEIVVTLIALMIGLFMAWAMAEFAWRSGVRGSLSPTAAANTAGHPADVMCSGLLSPVPAVAGPPREHCAGTASGNNPQSRSLTVNSALLSMAGLLAVLLAGRLWVAMALFGTGITLLFVFRDLPVESDPGSKLLEHHDIARLAGPAAFHPDG